MKLLRSETGMTLIEILVVLAIMALLATLVTTRVTGRLAEAKVSTAKSQIKTFQQALELYKADNDLYPTTEQGLDALISKPTIGEIPENYPEDGYLSKKKIPKDPWNKNYLFISEDGQKYTIMTYGSNKKEGGTGTAADISSDDL
jgi:general secretion pathway protein G